MPLFHPTLINIDNYKKNGENRKKIKFLNKAIAKYSKKYDYSLVDYIDSKSKVKIICKKHDVVFEQAPSEHLRGKEGCKACSGKSIVNTYSFIFEAKKTHNKKYDYSKSKYVNSKTKVNIVCPEHGEFEQLPSNHINGQGCPKCKGLSITEKKTMTTDSFIKKAIKKHDGYELSRFCNKINTTIIGGASKLLKHFIKIYNPVEIISYADRRWSIGNLYEKLGFNKKHVNRPNYWYIVGKERQHRFKYRKDVLIKEGFDENLTEHEIMINRGIYRIYDCGTITYKKVFY